MTQSETVGAMLNRRGVSRRAFMKYASYLTSVLALPATAGAAMAQGLAAARRQAVIWLSFQECTGCTESLTRGYGPTLEDLIFQFISLDYHHTLQAASGEAAEAARRQSMQENSGRYLVVVDGSVPTRDGGVYSMIAGRTNIDILEETVRDAAAVIAVGTCASFGGLPYANPNPTGAVPISELVTGKPVINVSGCPPIPEAMTGTIAHLLAFGEPPALDGHGRPIAFFGDSIHDRCYRRAFYERGQFAESFDDEGARQGWCLYKLGCKGPIANNACATLKWNGGASFPIQSGHGCFACAAPNFWDQGGFYRPLSAITRDAGGVAAAAAAAGAVLGAGAAVLAGQRKREAMKGTGK
ncbi:MAG: hydrogenase small subunit [Hyphomonadaceae bacterium]